jgi:hypothetical protein
MNFAPPAKKVCERGDETALASDLTSELMLRQQCIDPIRGENAVAPTHQLRSRALGL